MKFSCCAIARSRSAIAAPAPNTSCSAWRTSTSDVTPPLLAHLRQLQRFLARRQRAPRDIRAAGRARAGRSSASATWLTRVVDHRAAAPLAWPAAAPAPIRWRGGTGPRSRAPTAALPWIAQRRRRSRRPSSPAPRVRPPPACDAGVDARILVRARDAELRLALAARAPRPAARRRSASARCASAPAAVRPGTPPTTARRASAGAAASRARRREWPSGAGSVGFL